MICKFSLRSTSRLPFDHLPWLISYGFDGLCTLSHFRFILNNIIHLLKVMSSWTAPNKWTVNHINYKNNIQDTVWTRDIWIDSWKPCGKWAGSQLILELARINFQINLEPSRLAAQFYKEVSCGWQLLITLSPGGTQLAVYLNPLVRWKQIGRCLGEPSCYHMTPLTKLPCLPRSLAPP